MPDLFHHMDFFLPTVPVEVFIARLHTSILDAGANILNPSYHSEATHAERPLIKEDTISDRVMYLDMSNRRRWAVRIESTKWHPVMCCRLWVESLEIVNVLIRRRLVLGDDDFKCEVLVELNHIVFGLLIKLSGTSYPPRIAALFASLPVLMNSGSVMLAMSCFDPA